MTMTTTTRRAALGLIAAAGASLAPSPAAIAAVSGYPDAELIALGAEIVRRCAEGDQFQEARIMPHEDRFQDIIRNEHKTWAERRVEANAFDVETGRGKFIRELEAFERLTDGLFLTV